MFRCLRRRSIEHCSSLICSFRCKQGTGQAADHCRIVRRHVVNLAENRYGTFSVTADALATGTAGNAFASAVGYAAFGAGNDGSFELDFTNGADGVFSVAAVASAPDYATALAVGVYASVAGVTPLDPYATATAQALLSGSIVNDGAFSVLASAAGGLGSSAVATVPRLSPASNDGGD